MTCMHGGRKETAFIGGQGTACASDGTTDTEGVRGWSPQRLPDCYQLMPGPDLVPQHRFHSSAPT